jgi:hypothetical protein
MKKIILYIALAVSLILALISFRINKQVVNVQKQEILKEQETTTTGLLQHEKSGEQEIMTKGLSAFSSEQTTQQLPLPENRPAITIIKPPVSAKENSSFFSESIKNKSQGNNADSFSSRSNPAASEKESVTFFEEEGEENSSAITKINKQPSEIESKEMNEAGIIMY